MCVCVCVCGVCIPAVFSTLSLDLLPERTATLMVYDDVVQIVSGFQGNTLSSVCVCVCVQSVCVCLQSVCVSGWSLCVCLQSISLIITWAHLHAKKLGNVI